MIERSYSRAEWQAKQAGKDGDGSGAFYFSPRELARDLAARQRAEDDGPTVATGLTMPSEASRKHDDEDR
jgi:hypothetical protein